MTTIAFENSGQAFLEWDLDERQVVIACRPGMDTIWLGTVVLTKPVTAGHTIEVSLNGTNAIRRLIHRVQSVKVSPTPPARVTSSSNPHMSTKNNIPDQLSMELTTKAPLPLTKRELRKAATLLARHVRAAEHAKALFLRSSELLNEVIAAGVPVSVPIVLRSGRTVVLRDRFAETNEAFAPKVLHRFKVEDFKEPRPAKASAAPAKESAAAA